MKKQQKTQVGNREHLREKAGEIQQKIFDHYRKSSPEVALLPEETQRLIEELHLYQVELEMQNEQMQQVTQELAETVSKYEDLYDFAPVGYVTLDKFGQILEVNLSGSLLLKTERRLLVQTPLSRFVAAEHFGLFANFLQNMLLSDTKQTCQLTFLHPDHSVLEVRLEGIALMSRSSGAVQCRVAIIDITEQKSIEREMRKSQEFVEKIAFTMPNILAVYDLDTRQNLYENRELLSVLGYSAEKIRMMNFQKRLDLVHPQDKANFLQNLHACRYLKDGEVSEFEYRIKNQEGRYQWLLLRSVVFQRSVAGTVSQILSVHQDITFKREAEEELRFKNQIITGLQSNLPIVVSLINPDGTVEAVSGSALETLAKVGITDLQGKNLYQLFPEMRQHLETVFFKAEKVEFTSYLEPEQKIWFQNFIFLDKSLNRAIAFSIDISKQVEAEKRIVAEKEFSKKMLDTSIDGIMAFDKNFRFTAWNKVMEKNSNRSKKEILGKKISEIFPGFEKSDGVKALHKVLKGKRIILYNQNFGFTNEDYEDYEVYLNPLLDDTGEVYGGLCMLHNVKDRKKLETENTRLMLDQQKAILNAVLATQEDERKRIAEALHNGVGQMLYAAKLNLERNALENHDSQAIQINLLDDAIREVRTISFELQPSILQDFGLETALRELLKRIPMHGLKISLHTSGLTRFSADIEIAAYRIIQELLNNVIKHSKATIANLEITCKRDSLEIMAKDNGTGFDQKSMQNKTKGIGLTSIQNRVKLLDGKMEIESEQGRGTTVSITLPFTKPEVCNG